MTDITNIMTEIAEIRRMTDETIVWVAWGINAKRQADADASIRSWMDYCVAWDRAIAQRRS